MVDILAIYMVVSMGALSAGQLLLNVADPSGFSLFVLASILVSLSLVPVDAVGVELPRRS